MIAMTILSVNGCMLIISQHSHVDIKFDKTIQKKNKKINNSQPAVSQETTITQVYLNTFETNIHPHKHKKKVHRMTCSIASHTIALSFIYYYSMLH